MVAMAWHSSHLVLLGSSLCSVSQAPPLHFRRQPHHCSPPPLHSLPSPHLELCFTSTLWSPEHRSSEHLDVTSIARPQLTAVMATTHPSQPSAPPSSSVSQDTLVAIKVDVLGSHRRFKLALRDLGAHVLPQKVRHQSSACCLPACLPTLDIA